MKIAKIIVGILAAFILIAVVFPWDKMINDKKWDMFAKAKHCKQVGETRQYDCDGGKMTRP